MVCGHLGYSSMMYLTSKQKWICPKYQSNYQLYTNHCSIKRKQTTPSGETRALAEEAVLNTYSAS